MAAPHALRCAIYTRKSSEEGLEQDFNSLHAQRDSCEAYILSQAGEGWTALKAQYDDGGISGGTMERPGLKQLLADIQAGKVDVVVVYKVDRLTRSLTDFAKIVDVFDRHGASFVSVTQAFNTTSSMGRLTLNVLLSFAQFEREVTGERIRDKIAASKRKGLWMGGLPPLGYEAAGRTLKIVPHEADQVRHIYARYLELRSVHRLKAELEEQGFRSKRRTTRSGGSAGEAVLTRGALFYLLSNRLYLGEIPHKQECYPGQHQAIVDREVFDAAQALLAENRRRRAEPSARQLTSVLTGRIFDEAGQPMSPTTAHGRAGRRYRYYVSAALQQGEARADRVQRIPAVQVEAAVLALATRIAGPSAASSRAGMFDLVDRLELHGDGSTLTLKAQLMAGSWKGEAETLRSASARLLDGERAWLDDERRLCIASPTRPVFHGGRRGLVTPTGATTPRSCRPDQVLVSALRKAHALVRASQISPFQKRSEVHAVPTGSAYDRKLMRLAFLAPDVQTAILTGGQPQGLFLKTLLGEPFPACWSDQGRRFLVGGGSSSCSTAAKSSLRRAVY
jgi:DNA invertase Pin-like site-specific DNA recombinase